MAAGNGAVSVTHNYGSAFDVGMIEQLDAMVSTGTVLLGVGCEATFMRQAFIGVLGLHCGAVRVCKQATFVQHEAVLDHWAMGCDHDATMQALSRINGVIRGHVARVNTTLEHLACRCLAQRAAKRRLVAVMTSIMSVPYQGPVSPELRLPLRVQPQCLPLVGAPVSVEWRPAGELAMISMDVLLY